MFLYSMFNIFDIPDLELIIDRHPKDDASSAACPHV